MTTGDDALADFLEWIFNDDEIKFNVYSSIFCLLSYLDHEARPIDDTK